MFAYRGDPRMVLGQEQVRAQPDAREQGVEQPLLEYLVVGQLRPHGDDLGAPRVGHRTDAIDGQRHRAQAQREGAECVRDVEGRVAEAAPFVVEELHTLVADHDVVGAQVGRLKARKRPPVNSLDARSARSRTDSGTDRPKSASRSSGTPRTASRACWDTASATRRDIGAPQQRREVLLADPTVAHACARV
ncbi:hypothetical protein NJ76_15965, partial [Rhodococcus sp. IITR03]